VCLPRELEARCTLVAEEATWHEAEELIARARQHAGAAKLVALFLHADRLEGRALVAAGDPVGAVSLLERASSGFESLGARWEVALTELSRGEALVALRRDDEAVQVLEGAAEEFARLRVPRELERARDLLAGLQA
jgi:hypothetical protein